MEDLAYPAWNFLPGHLRACVQAAGFSEPTPVQVAAIPAALRGKNLQVLAPTGTGKTLVYLLSILDQLHQTAESSTTSARATSNRSPTTGSPKRKAFPQGMALIVVPTRELAFQVAQMLASLSVTHQPHTVVAVGGLAIEEQLDALRSGWHILIGTPGRLLDLKGRLPGLLRQIHLAVLDEFDRLLDMGFEKEVRDLTEALPPEIQWLMLSATPQDQALRALSLPNLERIDVVEPSGDKRLQETFFLLKTSKTKAKLLTEELGLLKPGEQAIVFVNNIAKCLHLNGLLKLRGFQVAFLHGHLPQEERLSVFNAFREGRLPILVSTDLAGRGFDIPDVSLIVNFDLPRTHKLYVHRAGRTARRGQSGLCLSFAGPEDWLPMRNLKEAKQDGFTFQPGFNDEEKWWRNAKRFHDVAVRREEKTQRIKREQGLSESDEVGENP